MLAYFNAAVAKAVIAGLVFILSGMPRSMSAPTVDGHPVILTETPIVVEVGVSDDGDTLSASKEEETAESEEAAKKEKPVRISITNKGILVGDEGDQKVILEFGSEEFNRQIAEKVKHAEAMHESLLADLEADEERFYRDRGRDLFRFGNDITIGRDELVRGDVVTIAGDIDIEGKVMGSVVTVFGDIELGPTSVVHGEVVCVLGELERDGDARIRGETVQVGHYTPSLRLGYLPPLGKGAFRFTLNVVLFIVAILLLGIVMAFLSDRMKRSSTFVFGSFFKTLGIGALVLIVGSVVIGVVAAILSITIVGIPIAVLVVFSFAALCLIGYFVSALALGSAISARANIARNSSFLQALIGLAVFAVLALLSSLFFFNPFMMPFRVFFRVISGFVNLLALLTGVGAFILSKAGTLSRETKPKLPE